RSRLAPVGRPTKRGALPIQPQTPLAGKPGFEPKGNNWRRGPVELIALKTPQYARTFRASFNIVTPRAETSSIAGDFFLIIQKTLQESPPPPFPEREVSQ